MPDLWLLAGRAGGGAGAAPGSYPAVPAMRRPRRLADERA